MRVPIKPRAKALRWLKAHRGLTEQPAGSNTDQRRDGIRAAQERLASWLKGQPWCGVWHANALIAAGVDFHGVNPAALASVATIEDLARAGRGPYGRGWTNDPRKVLRGDGAVMFGRGIHVVTVVRVIRALGVMVTDEGNTTSGAAGDQANGGGSYRRVRRLSDVHGFALVDYPGGWQR